MKIQEDETVFSIPKKSKIPKGLEGNTNIGKKQNRPSTAPNRPASPKRKNNNNSNSSGLHTSDTKSK